jgi:hypothetical protein
VNLDPCFVQSAFNKTANLFAHSGYQAISHFDNQHAWFAVVNY